MEYSLIRSGRRTLSIEISTAGEVLVRAPRHCAQRDIDRFIKSREEWIEKHIKLQRDRMAAHPEPDEERQRELIEKAKSELPRLTDHYAAIMELYPSGVKITGARKRFGSCSGDNRICYSWRLMQYPAEAIEYVVVHELAHIKEKNHGKSFYRLVESVLPDYKARREMLKK